MDYIIEKFSERHMPLRESFFETLNNLSTTPLIDEDTTKSFLKKILDQGSVIFVAVSTEHGIIGSLTLLLEYKLIRGGVVAGHIEDVVTRKGFEGKGIGKALMEVAIQEVKQAGCYKIILDCDKALAPFYERWGFKNEGTFMRTYLN